MKYYEKEMKRKIGLRKEAMQNLGLQQDFPQGLSDCISDDDLYKKFDKNLSEANESSYLNFYWFIHGSRAIVYVKKCLRKILKISYGWIIIPLIDRQNMFNGKMINSFTAFRDMYNLQQKKINQLTDQNNKLELELQKNQNKALELSDYIENIKSQLSEVTIFLDQQNHVTSEYKKKISENFPIILNDIGGFELKNKAKTIQSASSYEEMKNRLDSASSCYRSEVVQALESYKSKKEVVIVFCLRFKAEYGLEAIKNEAYDLFCLLRNKSIYDVRLVSLEEESEETNYDDLIMFTDRNNLNECVKILNPKLIVLFESTPYNVFDFDGIFVKNHTIIKLTAQNPLQGFNEETIDELRHCNDYGVHQYIVSSRNALNIMEQNGFRDIKVQYPIIDVDRIMIRKTDSNMLVHSPFVIGFASSPMEEKQYSDRGIELLIKVVQKLPDIIFKILWRNEKLPIPEELALAENCIVFIGRYDMKQFYQEIDSLIIPYKTIDNNHACSLSGMEAMVNGLPVIATKVSGISELISDFGIGVICEENSDSLIEGIQLLINNYECYTDKHKVAQILNALIFDHIISKIEDYANSYSPKNFITLEEWNYHLNGKDKYLVKGHDSIKEYYQRQEIATKYNEERFLEFPANCFDAFERVSIGIAFENIIKKNDIKILDIASGDGRIVQEDIKYGMCVAIDSSQAMLDVILQKYGQTERVITRLCDLFTDTLEDKFDVVTTFRYIRHFDYKERKLIYEKIKKCLNDKGKLIFDVPNLRYAMKDREKGNWGDFNIYDVFWTEDTIIRELSSNHFVVKYLIPIGIWSIENEPISWTVVAEKA